MALHCFDFFFRVPELVGTFRWHCYPACFLRPAAFVSLSPIVLASFVPWLQQWLFFASLYICALFALVCSVCFVLLSAVFFFPPAAELGNKSLTHTSLS